jgi:hypothetical protein
MFKRKFHQTLHFVVVEMKIVTAFRKCMSHISSVSIAMGCSLDDWCSIAVTFKLALGPTQPPLRWLLRAVSPGVKQLAFEADH